MLPKKHRLFQSPPPPVGYKIERRVEVKGSGGRRVWFWAVMYPFYDYRTQRFVHVPEYRRKHAAEAMVKRIRDYGRFGADIRIIPVFETPEVPVAIMAKDQTVALDPEDVDYL